VDIASLWDFDDPAGSEARLRDASEAAEGDDRSVLLTQVARALGLQDRFDEGHALLDSIPQGGDEVETRLALERGRLLRSAGDPAEARQWFEAAARLAAHARDEALELDALHMIPLCLEGEGRLNTTLFAVSRARSAATPEGRRWLASLLNNLGMAHSDEGDWPAALAAFEEALAERRTADDQAATFVARWMVAWALRNVGRVDEARAAQLALKADLTAAGRSDEYVDQELEILGSAPAAPQNGG
jgi:tetratricopeptide (TPR) repeat protein